jgi:ATP-dependent exoDNAse (exonuclease V) beta subunit
VHAVLQTIDLATGDGLVEAAAAQAAAEGVIGRDETIVALARAALRAPSVRESLRWRRWRETFVATTVGDRTLEGYVDLLYRTDAGLVVVDYKTASSSADLDAHLEHYRLQGGAYAVALEAATGEPVTGVVFVFLTPDGVVERALDDLDGCRAAVRAALAHVQPVA